MEINVDNLDFTSIKLIDETGQFLEIDLQKELRIDEHRLEQEMIEQPSKYIYWSSILEKLRLYQEQCELDLEFLLGRLDKEAREHLMVTGTKPTKDSVEAYIKRSNEYKIAKEKCNYYDYLVRRLQFIVKSLEQRKDMLQSINKQKHNDKIYGHGAGR